MKQEPTKEIKRLLVIRFSAMGDVAMTVPVVTLLARQHPDLRITMLTRHKFVPLFEWVPSNVEVRGIDLNNYKGLLGLERLFSELRRQDFDAVADLHDVLRTKYLHSRFRMTHAQVAVIDKERKQKRAFIGHALDHVVPAHLPHNDEVAVGHALLLASVRVCGEVFAVAVLNLLLAGVAQSLLGGISLASLSSKGRRGRSWKII